MELVALLLLLLLREGLNCERLQVPIHKIIPKEDAPGTRLRPSEKTKRGCHPHIPLSPRSARQKRRILGWSRGSVGADHVPVARQSAPDCVNLFNYILARRAA